MQKTVKKCPRAAVAVYSLASAMFLLGWRAAIAQPALGDTTPSGGPVSASKAPTVSTRVTAQTIGSPNSADQVRLEQVSRTSFSPRYSARVAEEDACRIIEATLISRNGPNGGWCWLVATDCGDQYQKGDCWYTESVAVRASAH